MAGSRVGQRINSPLPPPPLPSTVLDTFTAIFERSGVAQAGDTATAASLSIAEGGGGAGGRAYGAADALPPTRKRSGLLSPKASAAAESTAGPYSSSAIAAATAAAIAAGPLALRSSASDASGGGSGAPLPLLEVRGCTPIGPKSSRFEINLGQQLAHPSSLEWQVSLMWPAIQRVRRASQSSSLLGGGDGSGGVVGSRRMGPGGSGAGRGGATVAAKSPLKFRLYTLHTSDAKWLTLGGQREGQLLEGGSEVGKREKRKERTSDTKAEVFSCVLVCVLFFSSLEPLLVVGLHPWLGISASEGIGGDGCPGKFLCVLFSL